MVENEIKNVIQGKLNTLSKIRDDRKKKFCLSNVISII